MELQIAKEISDFDKQYHNRKDILRLLSEMNIRKIQLEKSITYISYNLIVYNKNLAYYLMNTGLKNNVYEARNVLTEAIKSFEMGNFYSANQISLYFQLHLLMSLSYEFFNEHNIAYTGYESLLKEIEKKYPFVDEETKNVLKRLMYIIEPDSHLENGLLDYSGRYIATTYQNKRRILEKKIQMGTANEGDVEEISALFKLIQGQIDKLYHVTHYRLMYMYYATINQTNIAQYYFSKAMDMAKEYDFFGQLERLTIIKNTIEG